ncbi:MAG: bifunctional DNA-formamidopyrimidine glycosylase/DNA-(apurinic or apyrimidinic site) lyase [Pseudomonadota bacterium]
MPELPEVETVRCGLEPVLVGARIARVEQRRPDLRFPLPDDFAARLEGRTIRALGRRAKYLLAHLDSGEALIMHLGMSGRFTISPGSPPSHGEGLGVGGIPTAEGSDPAGLTPDTALASMAHEVRPAGSAPVAQPGDRGRPGSDPQGLTPQPGGKIGAFVHATGGNAAHDHVVLHMASGASVTYNDPRRFGFMLLVASDELETHPLIRGLGVEPLGNELSAHYLAARAEGRRADLKAFLLDQRIIAGLGNIYVAEALFRARLSPNRAAACLARKGGKPTNRAERLVPAIRAVLEAAIRAGGSTLKDYRRADGDLGYFQHQHMVYGRAGEPCATPGCRGIVRRTIQGGRATFHCPVCQR